jgi:pyrroline-5-carboxylate reductase
VKICFVGCGNIAQAIIDGLLKSGIATSNIACVERNEKRAKLLRAQCLQIIELEKISLIDFNLIILAVKPKDALSAEKNIFKLAPNATILTVVAGISIKKYSQPDAIIRAMPNTACAFRKGITGIYAKDQTAQHLRMRSACLERLGMSLSSRAKMKCIDLLALLEVAKLSFIRCSIYIFKN